MTMSKKTLLNESQVRQFMKLAKLEPLTPGFVRGLSERTAAPPLDETHGRGTGPEDGKRPDNTSAGRRRRSEAVEDVEALDVDLPGEDVGAVEVEEPEEDVGAVEVEEPEEGAPMEDVPDSAEVADAFQVIAAALSAAGIEVEVEETGEGEEVEAELELEPEGEPFAREGEDVVADMELQESDEEDLEEGSKEITDDLVEQITKRVAARILKSALTKK